MAKRRTNVQPPLNLYTQGISFSTNLTTKMGFEPSSEIMRFPIVDSIAMTSLLSSQPPTKNQKAME